MAKKLILLGMALAAVAAFAMPAVASASPELRDEAGPVAKNAKIVGTSTNAITTNTKFGTLECAHVEVTGEVTSNSANHVAGKGIGKGTTATCFAGSTPFTVTDATLGTMTTNGGDKGTISLTFEIDILEIFTCHFESKLGKSTFTYNTGTGNDTIHVVSDLEGPEICLKEDEETGEPITPTFEGDFTLTTDGTGAPIWIQ